MAEGRYLGVSRIHVSFRTCLTCAGQMKAILVICVILVLCISSVKTTSAPSYCSYIPAEGYFDCDYSKMSNPADRPLNLSDFDPTPQRLVLRVNGFLPYLGMLYNNFNALAFQMRRLIG